MTHARQPSWDDVIDSFITSRLRSVHTALPGTIRSYDAAAQTATVELAVELETTSGAFERVTPPEEVPVTQPGAWADGDKCLIVFCEESFAKWFDTGSVEPPDVLARHGLHAVCIPMVHGASQFVALANLVDARLTAIQTAFDTHIHVTTATIGGSATPGVLSPTAAPIGPLASVAAVKVKAR